MGEKELREKYGGKLPKALNRAIRAEIPGGNEALDTLTQLAGPAMHSGWAHPSGQPTEQATAYAKHKRQVVDRMEAQIMQKYGIPIEPKQMPVKRVGKSSGKSGGKPGRSSGKTGGKGGAKKGPPRRGK